MEKLKVYYQENYLAITVTEIETQALIKLIKDYQIAFPRYKQNVSGLLNKTIRAPKEKDIAYFFHINRTEISEYLNLIKLMRREFELSDLKKLFERALKGDFDDIEELK